MKQTKLIAITLCLCAACEAMASDFPWLSFKMKETSEITVVSENLEINYSDGFLHLNSDKVNEKINVDNITSMSFLSELSGLNEIKSAISQPATYYNLNGIEAGKYASASDAQQQLPSGIYIVKTATESFKIIF